MTVYAILLHFKSNFGAELYVSQLFLIVFI